jgi:hypothetical protein
VRASVSLTFSPPRKVGLDVRPFHEPRFQWDVAGTGVRASFVVSCNARPHPNLLPGEKGQRLHASLYTVVRRANPVAGAWWFRGSMRELFRGNLSPKRRRIRFRRSQSQAFGLLNTLPMLTTIDIHSAFSILQYVCGDAVRGITLRLAASGLRRAYPCRL